MQNIFPYCRFLDQSGTVFTFELMAENFHNQEDSLDSIRDILAYTFKESSSLLSQGKIKGFKIRRTELEDVYQKAMVDT